MKEENQETKGEEKENMKSIGMTIWLPKDIDMKPFWRSAMRWEVQLAGFDSYGETSNNS